MSKIWILHNENTKYFFYINKRKTDIILSRLKTKRSVYENLIKTSKDYNINRGYFFYNKKAFNSYFFSGEWDIVFVNSDNKIIYLEKKFTTNKISVYKQEAKFLYLLPPKTIEKNNLQLNDIVKKIKIN